MTSLQNNPLGYPLYDSPKPWWQKKMVWLIGIVALCGLVGLPLACFGTMLGGISTLFKSSEVYQQAILRAQQHPAVIQALGEPMEPGWFTSGSIHISGPSGYADLAIPLSGPKNSGTIYARASKESGRWYFTRLEMAVKGQSIRINLIDKRETSKPGPAIVIVPPTPTPPPLLPTPMPFPFPTPTLSPALAEALGWIPADEVYDHFRSQKLRLAVDYPKGWQAIEEEDWVTFSPSLVGLETISEAETMFRVGREGHGATSVDLLWDFFPEETARSRVDGTTITITGGYTWSSSWITNPDGTTNIVAAPIGRASDFYILAITPASDWETLRPGFYRMMDSLRVIN